MYYTHVYTVHTKLSSYESFFFAGEGTSLSVNSVYCGVV